MSVSAGIRLNSVSRITCAAYPDHAPILSFWDGTSSVDIYLNDMHDVTEADVELARQLVEAAAKYAAEVERLVTHRIPAAVAP